MSYKFDGSNLGNNINVYMNGHLWKDLTRVANAWPYSNDEGYNGNLEIGHYFLGMNGGSGHMKLDELLIWELQLSGEDILQLYNSYEWVEYGQLK